MHFGQVVDRGIDGLDPPNTSAAVNGSDTYANVPLHIAQTDVGHAARARVGLLNVLRHGRSQDEREEK